MKENLIDSIEIEEFEGRQKTAERKKSKVIFYSLWIAVWFIAGTKLECLGISKMNKIWIYFIEHLSMMTVSFWWFQFIKWNAIKNNNQKLYSTFINRKILLICVFSAIWDAWGNLVLIFAIKFAFQAEVSPASISCMLMTNIILVLVFSIVVLREKHCWMEYFGGFLIIISVVIISYQRGGSSKSSNK